MTDGVFPESKEFLAGYWLIDVEGAELQVWRGMGRIVAESPDLSVVLEFGPSHLARVGASGVLCALSGGVDSTVTATLVGRAIGELEKLLDVPAGSPCLTILRRTWSRASLYGLMAETITPTPARVSRFATNPMRSTFMFLSSRENVSPLERFVRTMSPSSTSTGKVCRA